MKPNKLASSRVFRAPCESILLSRGSIPDLGEIRLAGNKLPSVVYHAHLPDHRHFDLPRILQFILNLSSDVSCETKSLLVAHLVTFHHDANFASSLKSIALGNTLERVGQVLRFLQPFHISL